MIYINDRECEQIVLGYFMVMLNGKNKIVQSAFDLVSQYEGKLFTTDETKAVWTAIYSVTIDGNIPDFVFVHNKLKALNLPESPNPHTLVEYTKSLGMPEKIMQYVVRLINFYERRVIYENALEIASKARADESMDLEGAAEEFTKMVNAGSVKTINFSTLTPMHRLKKTYEWVAEGRNKGGITGVPTGLSPIDTVLGGHQKGDLIVYGGRPGTFKTALMLHFAHHAARLGTPSLMFQQEMAEHQTGAREIAMVSGVSSQMIRAAQIDEATINKAVAELEDLPVYIDHTAGISIGYIRLTVRTMIEHKKVGIVIIDYLQLMDTRRGKNDTSEEALSKITRSLKQMAKEFNVPVILLSQLRRGDGRDFKTNARPSKADLKGSGAIEADADVVGMLYREYDKGNPDTYSKENSLTIIYEKNRMGATGDVDIYVDAATNTFGNEMPSLPLSSSAGLEPNTNFDMPF